jgi:predicted phage baseplate assembly protein
MPLEDLLPDLDDRTYDDLIREVRTRIARYAPEWRPGASAWTDVNDSDPGVTIAQVFAWLSEMLLYRLNRAPALNYVKFLQLIGIELKPAEPARADVTFGVDPAFAQPIVRVPQRAQLSADAGDGGPTLIFETTRALTAFRAVLEAVVGYDPDTAFTSFGAANAQAAQPFLPFGPRAPEGAYLALGLQDPASLPSEVLDLAFVTSGDAQGIPRVSCDAGGTSAISPAVLAWEYYDGAAWRGLTLLRDDTLALTRSGHVLLRLPPAGIPISAKTNLPASDPVARYWLRARIVRSQYARAPGLLAVRANTTEVEQAETIRHEVVGGSDGSRNQRVRLRNRPILKDSLQLLIQVSDEGPQLWTDVPDLFGSGPADDHYVLNRTSGEIRFGDGVNGNVPVAYVGNPGGNIVAREYRTGGGRRGNVPAGAISTLVTTVPGIDAAAVSNLQAAHSGRDEETLDEAKKRAPGSLRSRDRAVTAEDFEYLAAQAADVKRAKALPGFHPDFPHQKLPGLVSVIVVPDADPQQPMPMPSDGTLRSVCRFLDERRLITTEVFVLKPNYQKVEVLGEVVAAESADAAQVHEEVVASLIEYFHPLRGGESGSGWPFGGTIHYSRVYQRVFAVPGVASIVRLVIVLDGEEQRECADVPIERNGLLYSTDHAVSVAYDASEDL